MISTDAAGQCWAFAFFGGPTVRHSRNAWRRSREYDGFQANFAGSVLNAPLS
jgi:hypothetical protein